MKTIAVYGNCRSAEVWNCSILEAAQARGLKIEEETDLCDRYRLIERLYVEGRENEVDDVFDAAEDGWPVAHVTMCADKSEWMSVPDKTAFAADFLVWYYAIHAFEVPDREAAIQLSHDDGSFASEVRRLASGILRGEA